MAWFKTLREFIGLNSNSMCLCMIVSEQEGAEIWIDDKKTSLCTPKVVAVPRNTEVKITLKLTGHSDHTAYVKSGHHLSYYHCKLQRIPLKLIRNDIAKTASL